MPNSDEDRVRQENEELRRKLAKLGVRRAERQPGETVQEENLRLREDLRWYVGLLESV